jgi:hypothetical protein
MYLKNMYKKDTLATPMVEVNTVPIGQDQRKIILKLNAEILGIHFFPKKN